MQKSSIYKTLICKGEVSLAVLDTTATVQEAISRHVLSPVAAAGFGRTLTACAYLCSWLKDERSSLSVTVKGNGAGGKICISGDGNLDMRGFIEHPQVDLPPRSDGKLDVGALVGREGTLTVIRDDGEGIPFVGTSELISGEIAEDFSYYFLTSEQRPTAIALGVKIGQTGECLGAGGLFLQPLPNASEESIAFCESAVKNYAKLSSEIQTRGAEGVLRDFGVENANERAVRYRCHCSREKAEGLIIAMGKEEAERTLQEEGELYLHCHYCNTRYDFTKEELNSLFKKKESV